MTFLQFKDQWHRIGCFNIYQIRAWCPDFDRTNITRWVKHGYLLKLRQDWYAFSDMRATPDAARYVAYKMYQPSYISIHAALAIYGIIPESVTRITSVTTKRTTSYSNAFGEFCYQTVKSDLFFGYRQMQMETGGSYLIALPEKALLDLLYLYPQYNTAETMLELRLDEWWMQEEIDVARLKEFALRCGIKSVQNRTDLMLKIYRHD